MRVPDWVLWVYIAVIYGVGFLCGAGSLALLWWLL
jgi:hypothetical protein